MESILSNYDDSMDQLDGLDMIKSMYTDNEHDDTQCHKKHKKQKFDEQSEINRILKNIQKLQQCNKNNYIEQCIESVPYYPKFNKSKNSLVCIDHFTDFEKLKNIVINNTKLGLKISTEIDRFSKYAEQIINHAHYEHNFKLMSKGLPHDVPCPSCKNLKEKCIIEKKSKTLFGHYSGSKCGKIYMIGVPKNITERTNLLASIPIFELIKI